MCGDVVQRAARREGDACFQAVFSDEFTVLLGARRIKNEVMTVSFHAGCLTFRGVWRFVFMFFFARREDGPKQSARKTAVSIVVA